MQGNQIIIFEAIVFIAVVLMLVGIFVSRRTRPSSEARKPATSLTKNIAAAVGRTITRDTALTTPQSDAIVVTRDPVSNEWLVEVSGTRYRTLKEIHDDQAARKVLEALHGLQRFAGSIPITSAPAPIAPPALTASRATTSISSNVAAGPKFPAPKNSFLDQIEAILQKNLTKDRTLIDRSIHIGAAPDGSLLIEIDREFYTSPDEVPQPELRGMIKTSIQEWERS